MWSLWHQKLVCVECRFVENDGLTCGSHPEQSILTSVRNLLHIPSHYEYEIPQPALKLRFLRETLRRDQLRQKAEEMQALVRTVQRNREVHKQHLRQQEAERENKIQTILNSGEPWLTPPADADQTVWAITCREMAEWMIK